MYLLQQIPQCTYSDSRKTELYVRAGEGTVSYDTYFGAFAASYWKAITTVADVTLRFVANGNGSAQLVGLSNGEERVVAELPISGGEQVSFEPIQLGECDCDALFLRFVGAGAITLVYGAWVTSSEPQRNVRLGAVITTFNRQEYVARIVDSVAVLGAEHQNLEDRIRVTIIDNAGNLQLAHSSNSTSSVTVDVVPSRNLGGAGGFARGLIKLRDDGWATHALFMDDDITLEPESLRRTLSLLEFARDPMLCVHGAMISEDQPWLCVEAGADYLWKSIYPPRPLHRNEDLRQRDVALAARYTQPCAYSAWWYTAFPVAITSDNPLPVFIRGDDVAWGLMHTRGHIETLPGIAVWHADFDVKNIPAAVYYEIRNLTLANLLTVDEYRWWHLLKRFLGYAFLNLYSMRYLSTEYLIEGMNDFLKGPQEWMKFDHAAIHKRLTISTEERSFDMDQSVMDANFFDSSTRATRPRDFMLSILSFGGTLVPPFLRSADVIAVPVQKRAISASIRHNSVIHRHPRMAVGFIATRDSRRFWKLLINVVKTAAVLPFRYSKVARAYKRDYSNMVSDAYWQSLFNPN